MRRMLHTGHILHVLRLLLLLRTAVLMLRRKRLFGQGSRDREAQRQKKNGYQEQ
jgi:hypothetical protein